MARVVTTDVDIDCFGRDKILQGIECVFGRIDRADDKFERHPTGVYFQNIPRDPTTNISTIDHRIANDYGYFKIDFLNVNMYEGVRSEEHLLKLMDTDPPWEFFQYEEITDKLFHLKGYSYLLKRFMPKSIEDLAMILAMIRPAKAYLQSATWETVRKEIWDKSLDRTDYSFKRQHAVSYGLAVVVNLNLLIEQSESLVRFSN
jgi:DNA polymerase III alpha subunit